MVLTHCSAHGNRDKRRSLLVKLKLKLRLKLSPTVGEFKLSFGFEVRQGSFVNEVVSDTSFVDALQFGAAAMPKTANLKATKRDSQIMDEAKFP